MRKSAGYGMLFLWTIIIFSALYALASCSTTQHCDAYGSVKWEDDIHNPDNEEYVVEVAFNEGVSVHQVTQSMFNERYVVE